MGVISILIVRIKIQIKRYDPRNKAHLQIRMLVVEMVIRTEVDSNSLNLALKIFFGVVKEDL